MIKLHESWLRYLAPEFEKPYMQEIKIFLQQEIAAGKTIYPHPKNIFNAFEYTHFDNLKVVIIGQDPYHGPGQAHGLSFSVQDGITPPPSLKNIYKEIESDIGKSPFSSKGEGQGLRSGNLTQWAKQ